MSSRWPYFPARMMLSGTDRKIISDAYSNHPLRFEAVSSDQFLRNLENRSYTEWWCEPRNKGLPCNEYAQFAQESFRKFIDDETHFSLERQDFVWNNDRFSEYGNNGRHIDQAYSAARENVLRVVVDRAIHFFKKCDKYRWSKENDKENLRTSLEPWIKDSGKEVF